MSAGMVQSEVAIIIDAPYAKVHIEQNDLLDHTIMRAPVSLSFDVNAR